MNPGERRVWEGEAPGSEESCASERWSMLPSPSPVRIVRNVVTPTLTPFVPDGETRPRAAVLIAPGGALHFLAMEHEGTAVARWFQRQGVAAYVLKYRVASTPDDDAAFLASLSSCFAAGIAETMAPLLPPAVADADRAMELLRGDGVEHLAFLGFSAGARVGAELAMRATDARRPDIAALVYTTPLDAVAPGRRLPLFLLAAADDPLGIDGTRDLHAAWHAAGHPVEQHLYELGGHGFGISRQNLPVDAWPELLAAWLAQWGIVAARTRVVPRRRH